MTKEKIEKKIMFWSWLMMATMTLGMIIGGIYLLIETFHLNPVTWAKNFKLKASEALKKKAEDKKAAHEAKKKTVKKGYTRVTL